MKMFRKCARKAIDIGFLLIMIFALAVLIANYIGYNFYVVRSGSMEPNIHTGSLAIVYERADFYEMEVGDIVAFKLVNGELVTHRIEDITKIDGITHFLTKGDANEVSDGYTTNIQNFYGETVRSVPGVGYFVDWASSLQGRIVIVGILAIFLVIYYFWLNDKEEIVVQEEYEEIVEYFEIDENGNEIFIGSSLVPAEEPTVDPPILVIEEDGVEIECVGEENQHEDNPPADDLDAECTAFTEDETVVEEEIVEENDGSDNKANEDPDEVVKEEPVKEELVEEASDKEIETISEDKEEPIEENKEEVEEEFIQPIIE